MKKSKNDLKQLSAIIVFIIILLIGYITQQSELSANILNETEQTSSINSTNINIDDIPSYSGKIVIDINNNVPYFEDKDLVTDDFEYYSNLDELNRAGVTI